MTALRIAGIASASLMLAACASTPGELSAAQPPDSMEGRWILAEPNAPTCGINFGGTPGVQEGPLLPEGGCPENFYMSKGWSLNHGTLTIKDEAGEPLAQMSFAGGRFDGQSTAGTLVTLTR